MNADLTWRMKIGCLGALTPILINVLLVDLQTALSNLTLISAIFYGIRVLALCAAACIVVYLNSDEVKPIKLFQLGIAAPALLTGMINGAVITKQQNAAPPPAANAEHGSMLGGRIGIGFPLIGMVTPAQAQEAKLPAGVFDCTKPPAPTFGQQALKGLIGALPNNQWFVVVEADTDVANSLNTAKSINEAHKDNFIAKVCAPAPAGNRFYRVVIGEHLTLTEANALRSRAVAAGVAKDTSLWNPIVQ